ncbi:DUF4871 domain-containing protein [Paenibacillus sp. LMG 31456]|uniref:DUF4871 domain-containing protein n=1 Tax=Paenibacillus foliorum TaxID=2654974 RepID=A0A972GUS5_9BACL|nr:DUF4871 domain-containing protein [Paenibacillus foliorum]NOU97256.1 DUF4871 domain-containing protein [Paenibacillus foliorum]
MDPNKPDWAKRMTPSPFSQLHFTKELTNQILRNVKDSKRSRHVPIATVIISLSLVAAVLFIFGISDLNNWAQTHAASFFNKTTKDPIDRTEYYEHGKLLFAVFPQPELTAGNPAGYIFHFTAPFNELQGKMLTIYAIHKKSGLKVTAVAPIEITKPSSGYKGLERFGTHFALPIGGVWRYVVELDGKLYGDVELTLKEPSWEPTSIFKSANYRMRGVEKKLGFIDAGFLANSPQKYMWHFWDKEKELNGKFFVRAVKQGEDQIIDVFSTESLAGALNGADRTAVSMMSLPEKGRWRLLPYIDNRLLETIVVEVN